MVTATSTTESFLFDEVTTSIAWEHFFRRSFTYPLLTSMRGSTKYREQIATYSDLDIFTSVTEEQAAPEDKPVQQYEKQFVHTEYKKKVPASRRLFDDEEWGWFAKVGEMLGTAASKTFDANCASLWNNAYGTTTSADSVALVSNSHTDVDGSYTFDNYITKALSVEGIRQARKQFRDLKDSRNQPMEAKLDAILVPTALEEDGLEIARSADRPDTASRATNIYMGTMDVIVWNRLTLGDAYWFALDRELLMMNAIMLMRVAPEFFGFGNVDTGVRYLGGYFRYSQGFVDFRGVVGSDGTT